MTKIIGSPTRYIQGKGELKKLAAHASSLGKKLFVIVDKNIQDMLNLILNSVLKLRMWIFSLKVFKVNAA
ncbi:MAG: hypothetical protein ACLRHW_11610 [Coprobacillus cateniformis]